MAQHELINVVADPYFPKHLLMVFSVIVHWSGSWFKLLNVDLSYICETI